MSDTIQMLELPDPRERFYNDGILWSIPKYWRCLKTAFHCGVAAASCECNCWRTPASARAEWRPGVGCVGQPVTLNSNLMRTTAVLAVLIAAATIVSCRRDFDEPTVLARRTIPGELPGCYEIALDSSIAAPPPARAGDPAPQRRDTIDLVPAGATAMLALGVYPWSVDSLADSVRIGTATGMEPSGPLYVLGFRPGADTLRGRLVLLTDKGPPFIYDGGRIWAVRITCRLRTNGAASPPA